MSDSEASGDAAAQELANSLRKMGKLVTNLMARADAEPFREPVDWKGLGLYDYPKLVSKMMDLGTVKTKLDKGQYTDAADCADDVRLVWKNCMTYNADGSDFHRLAESYSQRFEERYQKLIDEFGEDVICGNVAEGGGGGGGGGKRKGKKKARSGSLASSGRNTPLPLERGASAGTAKPAEAEFDAAGVVPLDVRTRFAARLQRLSGMELGHVLQSIDQQCPEALEDPTEAQLRSDAPPIVKRHRYFWDEFDGGCQIEIDVDAIPPETFWKLDEYVREKVAGRGRGPWSDDLPEAESSGKKKKQKV
ncbi:hypothetical protein ACHAXT_006063 [Thalassiosira profunda]